MKGDANDKDQRARAYQAFGIDFIHSRVPVQPANTQRSQRDPWSYLA